MKGIILLTNHFEDVEALITIDMLRRANITIDLVSMENNLNLVTQSGVKLQADLLLSNCHLDDYDFLVIPGGKAVFETHLSSNITKKVIEHFNQKQQLIATICAAPAIIGQMGLLENHPYICFPGCESHVKGGNLIKEEKVVVSDHFITAKAAGATFLFAYEIIKYLKDEKTAKMVLNNVYY